MIGKVLIYYFSIVVIFRSQPLADEFQSIPAVALRKFETQQLLPPQPASQLQHKNQVMMHRRE